MSAHMEAASRIDELCEELVNTAPFELYEFKIAGVGVAPVTKLLEVDMSLGMTHLEVAHRDSRAQQQYAEAHAGEDVLIFPNPAARIRTYGAGSRMANYLFDRETGLVAVNKFEFPSREVRPLSDRRRQALERAPYGESLLRQSLTPHDVRVLTLQGMTRLAVDLEKVAETL